MLIRSPNVLYDQLDKYVVGQDDAKKKLALAYFLHSVRSLAHTKEGKHFNKTPIMLYGPTGCGKTYLIDVLCRSVNMPYIRISAKDVTGVGWSGKSIEDVLIDYVCSAAEKFKHEEIPYGLLHIDEFDKICVIGDMSDTGSGWAIGQQQNWLGFIEGIEYQLGTAKQVHSRRIPSGLVKFDSSNMFVVVSGSFAEMDDNLDKSLLHGMGFSNPNKDEIDKMSLQKKFTDAGMIKELVGRFSMISRLNALDKVSLLKILKTPNNIFTQYTDLLGGLGLKIPNKLYKDIVDRAIASETGARGLQFALESEILKSLFDLDFSFSEDINKKMEDL